MKEIFVYDLNKIPIGSQIHIMWKNREKGNYIIQSDGYGKGKYVSSDKTGYYETVYFAQSFVDRVWLIK